MKSNLWREAEVKDFHGRTIKKVDTSACNFWTFHFTEGDPVSVEVIPIANELQGMAICNYRPVD